MENTKQTENEKKFFVSSEQTYDTNNKGNNPLQSIIDFLARNYIVINRVYGVVQICISIIVLLASLLIAPLLKLASALTVGDFETRLAMHLSHISGFSVGVSIIVALFEIAVSTYIIKTAKFADKQAVLVVLLAIAILTRFNLVPLVLILLALGSKVAALYIYRNRSLEEQMHDLANEFKAFLQATKK